jgi:hypothetical protein
MPVPRSRTADAALGEAGRGDELPSLQRRRVLGIPNAVAVRGPSTDVTVDATRHKTLSQGDERVARARLVSSTTAGPPMVVDLGTDRVLLGRAPEDLASPSLDHPTASRRHVELEWDAALATHLVRDLGSKNGSWVDGVPCDSASWQPLGPNAVLRVGGVLFVYEKGHTLDEPDAAAVSRRAIPGEALAVRRLRQQIARAAPDTSPALIIGETGTGKEQIARELHRLSGRKGDFVPVNCATFGATLIESQLFGHTKGAFTGATSDQPGLFSAAHGGTLFLDEIGEMPLELQPKLLRAIQEREIRAVGATKSEQVDVRIVAATHRHLAEKARAGEFRQDLYARLALWELAVPSVRERKVDIPRWIQFLHEVWLRERKLPADVGLELHPDALEVLLAASWPENLRGLNRFVHELATRPGHEVLRKDQIPAWVRA